jgi:hypothetical protein
MERLAARRRIVRGHPMRRRIVQDDGRHAVRVMSIGRVWDDERGPHRPQGNEDSRRQPGGAFAEPYQHD